MTETDKKVSYKVNELVKKGIERLAKDLHAIHVDKKVWTVTGRAFTGRDGIAYSAGMSAPKTNAKAFGWTLPSDLFTLEDARAFANIITTHANGTTLAEILTETAESVAKYNHDNRYSAFIAIAEYVTTTKTVKAEKVAAIIAGAKSVPASIAKIEKSSDLSILGL